MNHNLSFIIYKIYEGLKFININSINSVRLLHKLLIDPINILMNNKEIFLNWFYYLIILSILIVWKISLFVLLIILLTI